MKESKENYVELKGFGSTIGIKTILNYLYTGYLEVSFETIDLILDAGSHLQINEIIHLCSKFLIRNLNVLNCVNILKLAGMYATFFYSLFFNSKIYHLIKFKDTFSLKNVVEITQQYLNENIIEIYQNSNDQFYQLSYEQIKNLLDNDCLQVCTELDLFLILIKWIEGGPSGKNKDGGERIKHAASLMKSIRFMCISPDELVDYVEKVECMHTIPECKSYLMEAYRYHGIILLSFYFKVNNDFVSYSS
jgi:hypothetical protein